MENSPRNTLRNRFKAHTGIKKALYGYLVIKIALFLAIGLFLVLPDQETQQKAIPLTIIDSDDNSDNALQEIKLKNPQYENLDLDAVFEEEDFNEKVLDFKLKSHPSVEYVKKVGAGKQVVMYYDVNSQYGLSKALGEPEFINMKTGEIVERDWRYVYFGNETRERQVCAKEDSVSTTNGTQIECVEWATETYEVETWLPYNSTDIPKGQIRLGIEVEVKWGDHIDGVWVVGGKEIDRHAEWIADTEETWTISQGGHVHEGNYTVNLVALDYGILTNVRVKSGDSGDTTDVTVTVFQNGDTLATKTVAFPGTHTVNVGFTLSDYDNDDRIISPNLDSGKWSFHVNSTTTLRKADSDLSFSGNLFTATNQRPPRSDNTGDANIKFQNQTCVDGNHDDEGRCDEDLTVTLLFPEDNANLTSSTNDFIWSVSDPESLGITNTTIEIWNTTGLIYNFTNSSGIAGSYTDSITLSDGDYSWNATAVDSTNFDTFSSATRSFSIDTTKPTININHPTDGQNFPYLINLQNITLNTTITDSNLDSCWYNYNGTNTTFSCSTGVLSENDLTINNESIVTVYANDTFGNTNSSTSDWTFTLFDFDEYFYTDPETESTESEFTGKFQTPTSISSAQLEYNNTNISATLDDLGGNIYNISATVTTPLVSSSTNITWFFWVNGQNATSQTQTVNPFNIDDCSVHTNQILNFTMVDEGEQSSLDAGADNTSIKLDLDIYSDSGLSNKLTSFSQFYDKTLPARVCLSENITDEFFLNYQVEYTADSYSTEFYNVQNYNLNASSGSDQDIVLRDLLTADAQIYELVYRDTSFLPINDAIIQVKRKYVDEGLFKIVEAPITDPQGETVASIVSDDVIYTFTVVKNGQILDIFDNVRASCQNPTITTCRIELNSFSSGVDVRDFETDKDFSYSLGYDSSTRVVSSTFTIPSGDVETVTLNISKTDALGTEVCTDTLTSSSGTLSCVVPNNFGNATVLAQLYKDDGFVAQGTVNLERSPGDIYGASLVFIGLFLMLTLLGAGISDNPAYTVTFFMVGVILLFAINLVDYTGFIGGGATILWLIMAIIILIVKIGRRS